VKVASLRVLCIEDEAEMRHLLRLILSKAGHHVTIANDAVQGIDLLRRMPLPDVLVVNYLMPRLSGMEVVQFVAADRRFCGVGVIFQSAVHEREKPTWHPAWPRVDVWLPVPFYPHDLLAAVERARLLRQVARC